MGTPLDARAGHADDHEPPADAAPALLGGDSRVPGAVRMWLLQVGIWLMIITAVRLVVSAGFFFAQGVLYTFYAGIFEELDLTSPRSKTLFAVLLFPIFGDSMQIIVQDGFLKKHGASPA